MPLHSAEQVWKACFRPNIDHFVRKLWIITIEVEAKEDTDDLDHSCCVSCKKTAA